MRFARIIGRVTLNLSEPSYKGGRFLIGLACDPRETVEQTTRPLPKCNTLVIFDTLGATTGDLVGYTDGGEAAAPFSGPTPCDAYNAAIIENLVWKPGA